jgi:hypothetical protein
LSDVTALAGRSQCQRLELLYPDYAAYSFAPQYPPYPRPVAHGVSSRQVAESLLASAEFRALRLGS